MTGSLKSKLAQMQPTIGSWIMIAHPAMGEIMARAGCDFVTIDLEHTATDLARAEEVIRAIQYGGSAALVRLTSNDENQIKRVMDAGATGIIIPLVRTAAEMQRGVAAMYYPSRGTRGVGLARAQHYGAGSGFVAYQNWLAQEAVCIAQIEHIEAVQNLQEILSVPGVDGYIIGPYDLSASMGLAGQLDHPDVLAAIDKARQVGLALNKPGGMHLVEPDPKRLQELIDKGFRFLAYSIDTRMIDHGLRAALAQVRSKA